jgi:hypothetical protein
MCPDTENINIEIMAAFTDRKCTILSIYITIQSFPTEEI